MIELPNKFNFVAFSLVSFFFIYLRLRRWRVETQQKIQAVLHEQTNASIRFHDNHELSINEHMKMIPLAVQRYLHKACFLVDDLDRGTGYMMNSTVKTIESVKFQQEGMILNNGTWLPFRATQVVYGSVSSPGFVWEAKANMYPSIPILKNLKIYARDSYVEGEGDLSVDALGIIPVVRMKNNSAQLMRWLSEICLYPTACLPQSGNHLIWVKDSRQLSGPWSEHHGPFVRARICGLSDDVTAEVQLNFDDEGLIKSVRSHRAEVAENGVLASKPWEGRLDDYKVIDGMIIPTQMEGGYWNGDKYECYFRAVCHSFQYTYFR